MVSATPTPEEAEPSRLGHVDTSRTGKGRVQTHQGYIRSSDQEPETPRTAVSSFSASNTLKQPSDLPLSRGKAIALVATVTGAAFLNTLSLQSVVIILPTIGQAINIPDSRLQWIASAYSLTFGCFLLLWGRIADIYGKRLLFIGGSIWVTIVTAVNPFMPNEISFDLMRGLHGLGAAANVPTAIGILGVTFPPGKAKNYAFATYGAGAPLGSVFGNILSGIVAEYADWKWIFGITAILAAITSIAGYYLIPAPASKSSTSSPNRTLRQCTSEAVAKLPLVDWIGGFLITVGLLALLLALTEGNVVGWSTPWISALIVVSVIIIALFVAWQWYLERQMLSARGSGVWKRPPLMKVRIFRNLRFSAAMAIMCVFFASFNNFLIFATYYYQDFQGHSPLQTMLRFLPTGVGGIMVSFAVAFLLSCVPTTFLLIGGTMSVSVACLLFAAPIPPTTSYFAFGLWAMTLAVIGADTTWPCMTLFTSQALPPDDQAIGGALINAVSQIGRAIGLAIATAVQTAVTASENGIKIEDVGPAKLGDPASLAGLRAANWLNFGFGIASVLLVIVAFRTMDIIGRNTSPSPSETEQGMMNDSVGENTEQREKKSNV